MLDAKVVEEKYNKFMHHIIKQANEIKIHYVNESPKISISVNEKTHELLNKFAMTIFGVGNEMVRVKSDAKIYKIGSLLGMEVIVNKSLNSENHCVIINYETESGDKETQDTHIETIIED